MRRVSVAFDVCLVWLLLILACHFEVTTAGSGGAHPHQGVVQPFRAGDPGVKLDKAAEKLLGQGKPYQTQIQSGSAGRGLVVQDIAAPTQVVWERILDFNTYNKMVPKTMESQIYKREKAGRGGAERIWVRMKVGFTPAPRLTFYVNHLYQPQLNSMTWTLDYSRKSDFDDSCGYWYVVPHPANKEWTRVYYSVEDNDAVRRVQDNVVQSVDTHLWWPTQEQGGFDRTRRGAGGGVPSSGDPIWQKGITGNLDPLCVGFDGSGVGGLQHLLVCFAMRRNRCIVVRKQIDTFK
eukprot:scaffold294_cov221-Amphora_coffeaeformis.AAC.63